MIRGKLSRIDGDFDAWFDKYVVNPRTNLNRSQLVKRLRVGEKVIENVQYSSRFASWTQARDPDGVAWQYDGTAYYPITEGD